LRDVLGVKPAHHASAPRRERAFQPALIWLELSFPAHSASRPLRGGDPHRWRKPALGKAAICLTTRTALAQADVLGGHRLPCFSRGDRPPGYLPMPVSASALCCPWRWRLNA